MHSLQVVKLSSTSQLCSEAAAAERGRGHSYVLMCMHCGWGHDSRTVSEHHILFGVPLRLAVCSVSYRIITSKMNEKMENLIPWGGGGGGGEVLQTIQ